MASYIDDTAVKTLKEKPRYKSQDDSPASKMLQPFWDAFLNLMPMWLAPNMITLLGFGAMVVSYVTSSFYSPDFRTLPPAWVHVLCAFCLFMYQTMDAIDGMQARRTKAGSVVGEFLDNFIDIPSMMLALLAVCTSLRFDGLPLVLVCLSLIAVHFGILWETNHSKVMAFGVGSNAVTEGQLMLMTLHLVTFFAGPEIWDTDVLQAVGMPNAIPAEYLALVGGKLRLNMVVVGVAAGVLNVVGFISAFLRVMLSKDPAVNKPLALFQLTPLFATIGGLYYVTVTSPSNILVRDVRVLAALIIFIECMLLGGLVIHRMCGVPFRPLPIYLWPLVAICVNNWLVINKQQANPIFGFGEPQLLFGYTALLAVLTLHLAGNVIYNMCTSLNIPFLTIRENKEYLDKNQKAKKI